MVKQIDLSRVDLNLLVLFEVVLVERHVGRAADRLHLSRSAVSHGVGRLRRLLNDPVFVRTPRGVVPTERALQLAGPIAELLERARNVIATAEPFDRATSSRRFTIGAPDGVSAVIVPPLLDVVRQQAPFLDIAIRQLSPTAGETTVERAWRSTFADLDGRAMDVAVVPLDEVPPRFAVRLVYEENFVVAMRDGHPFASDPTLDRYCAMQHLVVSLTGEAFGFVDIALAAVGRSRRIALTVPNFMFALAAVAETDLLSALPGRFVERYGHRFGIISCKAPLPLGGFRLNAVAPRAALMDAGLSWLFDVLGGPSLMRPRLRGRG